VTTAELLAQLRERKVQLWVEEGRLKCSAPVGVLDATTKAALSNHKQEIIAFLHAHSGDTTPRGIAALKSEGQRPPLFAVPDADGAVSGLMPLVTYLDLEQPLFAVQPLGLDGSDAFASVEELACYELEQIRRFREQGPYLLVGYRAGGAIAFEIARQLMERRQKVALLALVCSPFPTAYRRWATAVRFVKRLVERGPRGSASGPYAALAESSSARLASVNRAALRRYRPGAFAGRLDLFIPSINWREAARTSLWRTVAQEVREHVCSAGNAADRARAAFEDPGLTVCGEALGRLLAGRTLR